ncbi:IS110 family transposase [Reyranella sp.]|uniref:IS110 family transposase n=1 Tax=Reyranella sp. TaxID=1929291 RepID=UPI003D0ED06E
MSDVSMVVAGIDIGKARLDVALHGAADRMAFDNSAAGHHQLIQWLRAAQVVRVGLESTGSYSQEVTGTLREAGFEVAVLQPLQVRAFAQYRLRRAKSDPLDAALIATCAALLDKVHEASDARLVPLAEHLRLIEQLEDDVVRAKTRLEAAHLAHVRRFLRREVERLERREAAERILLMKSIAAEPDLLARLQLIQSVDGVGERTALSLLLLLPELGRLEREPIVSLAGLAPFVRQSGKWRGQSRIGGGRDRVRRALYAASLAAAFRWNPSIKALYQRLKTAGKPHRKIMIACARKMLIQVNAVVARGTPWISSRRVPA